jgi:hypothetical protein
MITDLWELPLKIDDSKFCETWQPWKMPKYIYFINYENQGNFQNGSFWKEKN